MIVQKWNHYDFTTELRQYFVSVLYHQYDHIGNALTTIHTFYSVWERRVWQTCYLAMTKRIHLKSSLKISWDFPRHIHATICYDSYAVFYWCNLQPVILLQFTPQITTHGRVSVHIEINVSTSSGEIQQLTLCWWHSAHCRTGGGFNSSWNDKCYRGVIRHGRQCKTLKIMVGQITKDNDSRNSHHCYNRHRQEQL